MCRTFIPMMSRTGRIVNVSSTASSLSGYSKEIQDRFRNSKMTLDDLEQMMTEYQVRSSHLSLAFQWRSKSGTIGGCESWHGKSRWMENPSIQCQ